ncbi:hypothetical protein [Sphingomonas sp.]|uniref:hypothetical protein n=1 Tax=Sphingomonas sp. TaxID=28214 RepID=UPI002DD67209|nr:hypothetical protein [Sphingomonas sp.]
MKHKWAIQVASNYSWFESLVDRHNPVDVGFLVDTYDAQPNQYAIVSHHLDDLTDEREVIDRATALVSLLDGALHLQQSHYAGMHTIDLVDLDTEYRSSFADGSVLADPFSSKWSMAQIPQSYGQLRLPTERMLFMARTDELTRDMLRFLGVNGPTWITLYALKDYMKRGGWDENMVATAAGVPDNEVVRFRRTANNPAAVGPFARHGEQGHEPPKVPMALGEASKLILSATGKFLDQRAKTLKVAGAYIAQQTAKR